MTRYEDVRAILLQPTVFVNGKGITIEPGEPAGLGDSEGERGQGALSYTDPPQHGPLRRVLAQHFAPSRMRSLAPLVRDHASRLVQRLADGGGGDFVTEVVDPYPLRVLAAVLGLPAETEAALHRYVGSLDDSKALDDAVSDDAVAGSRMAATIEFLAAVHELASKRAADPGPDLISAMVTGTGEGAGLAAERIGGILIQLAIAGNDHHPRGRRIGPAGVARAPGAVDPFGVPTARSPDPSSRRFCASVRRCSTPVGPPPSPPR